MVRVEIVKDIDLEGVRLHPCNIEEIKSLCEYTPEMALKQLCRWTYPRSYVIRDSNKVLSFCGIDLKGQIWLFFADIKELPVSYFKVMLRLIRDTQKDFPYMSGMIYEKNVFALRFAKFVRARIGEPQVFGARGDLFYKFEIGG
jgi:hypothetical protein